MTTNNNIDCRFVSYTGKSPNLCMGILTLSINGVNKTFGMYDRDVVGVVYNYEKQGMY